MGLLVNPTAAAEPFHCPVPPHVSIPPDKACDLNIPDTKEVQVSFWPAFRDYMDKLEQDEPTGDVLNAFADGAGKPDILHFQPLNGGEAHQAKVVVRR